MAHHVISLHIGRWSLWVESRCDAVEAEHICCHLFRLAVP
jgi:hypothetical protein